MRYLIDLLVLKQVFFREDAALLAHILHESVAKRAVIERVGSLIRYETQSPRQGGIFQCFAELQHFPRFLVEQEPSERASVQEDEESGA